jgi:broad-specificity NMP kinase
MILWLNGTFGVGKTTTSRRIAASSAEWRPFDPEWVGYMLRANLDGVPFDDFQELDAWRRLVPLVMNEVALLTGKHLVASQTVLVEHYWRELRSGLEDVGHEVFHVLLDCDETVLRDRIVSDVDERSAREWRVRHLDDFRAARTWMVRAADQVVDTTSSDPGEVAAQILDAVR